MIRLIALHGRLSGSAVLRSSGGKTEFMLKTRNAGEIDEGSLSAYLIAPAAGGSFRMVRAGIKNGSGGAEIDGVRGMVITGANGIVSEGSSGMSETALERAKVQLRLGLSPSAASAGQPAAERGDGFIAASSPGETGRQAGHAEKGEPSSNRETGRPPGHAELDETAGASGAESGANGGAGAAAEGGANVGASPVTRRILSQAKALFGTGYSDAIISDAQQPEAEPPTASHREFSAPPPPSAQERARPQIRPYSAENEAVKNPFPALFPNSSWRRDAGSPALFGKVKHRGRLHEVMALPREGRFPPNELSPFPSIRTARAEDGRIYWLGVRRL